MKLTDRFSFIIVLAFVHLHALLLPAIVCATFSMGGCRPLLELIASPEGLRDYKPDKDTVTAWQAGGIKPGTTIEVVLKDDNRIIGEYVGLEIIPVREYRERYENWRSQNAEGLFMPALGDSIIVITNIESSPRLQGEFMGFDPRIMKLRPRAIINASNILVRHIEKIHNSHGDSLDGARLQSLMEAGDIPVMTRITIRRGYQTTLFQLDEVKKNRNTDLGRERKFPCSGDCSRSCAVVILLAASGIVPG